MTIDLTDPNSGDYEAILEVSDNPDLDDEQRVRLARHALSRLFKTATIDDLVWATSLDRARVQAVLDQIDDNPDQTQPR